MENLEIQSSQRETGWWAGSHTSNPLSPPSHTPQPSPPRSQVADPARGPFPGPRAAEAASAGFGERAGSPSAPGNEQPPWGPALALPPACPVPWRDDTAKPWLPPSAARARSSEVSLGWLAGLCNQAEVVWGARRPGGQSCSAAGMEGAQPRFTGCERRNEQLGVTTAGTDKSWVMQEHWLYWESCGTPLWARA